MNEAANWKFRIFYFKDQYNWNKLGLILTHHTC